MSICNISYISTEITHRLQTDISVNRVNNCSTKGVHSATLIELLLSAHAKGEDGVKTDIKKQLTQRTAIVVQPWRG